MDGAVTREEAEARWRMDLEEAETSSQQTWPRDITAGTSEFEWLTLITEILLPVQNELALEFEETRRLEPAPHDPVGSHGDGDETGDLEETGETGVNQVYSVILATAAACNRWLKESLGAGTEGRRAGLRDPDDPGPGDRHRPLGQGTCQAHDGRTGT